VQGYHRALEAAGLRFDPRLVADGAFTPEGGHRAMQALLQLRPRPTAVFASNDLMAVGAVCAAAQAGLRVPDDLSVIGFDDIALAAYCNPPLTTIAQPKQQTGELAARLLMQRIADPSRPLQREILQPSLCLRQSTARCREAA
jgi:LacI family transcriptional regulator